MEPFLNDKSRAVIGISRPQAVSINHYFLESLARRSGISLSLTLTMSNRTIPPKPVEKLNCKVLTRISESGMGSGRTLGVSPIIVPVTVAVSRPTTTAGQI